MENKFRKKPVEIEAIQWTGDNLVSVREFMGDERIYAIRNRLDLSDKTLLINTLEGQMIARGGDWIIRGVAGEFYPCKPDIFEQTYEPVSSSPTRQEPT